MDKPSMDDAVSEETIKINKDTGLPLDYISANGIESEVFSKTWIVDGVVEHGKAYQWFGEWKSGKTLAIMDICSYASLGMEWGGRRTVQSLVIWVASESCEDVRRRLAAWKISNGVSDGMPFVIRTKPLHLDKSEFADQLAAEVKAIKASHPDLPIIVVVDTVARSMSGETDENDEGLRLFSNHVLDIVVRPLGCAAILVHHSGHGDKERGRGWSGFPAAVDGSVKVSMEKQDGGPSFVNIKTMQMRSGKGDDSFRFRVDTQEILGSDNFGNPIDEPVLCYVGDGSQSAGNTPNDKTTKGMALKLLFDLFRTARTNLEEGGRDPGDARVEEATWRTAFYEMRGATPPNGDTSNPDYIKKRNAAKIAFKRAVDDLIGDRKIIADHPFIRIAD